MSKADSNHSYPILLIEDNPDDAFITERAMTRGGIKNKLIVVNDGEMGINYLKKEGKFMDVISPILILLDLKMPKVDGFEVLKVIKKDKTLKKIPVIILTTSDRDKDIDRAFQLGCNSYLVKPVNFETFIQTVSKLNEYWLTLSKIPLP